MTNKVKELRELRRFAEEIAAEIEAIQDEIKAEMTAKGVDEIAGADFKVTWKEITSTRLDTAALKKDLPDIAARYAKTSTARRFTIS